MINTFVNSFKVSFAEKANIFIYFLKRIPLLGKKIPDNLYKKTHDKFIIGINMYNFRGLVWIYKKSPIFRANDYFAFLFND